MILHHENELVTEFSAMKKEKKNPQFLGTMYKENIFHGR